MKEAKVGDLTLHTLDEGPPIIGHYSHAVELPNGLVVVSGQKAWKRPSGAILRGTVSEQTELAFDNARTILAGIGLDIPSIVRVSCHLADINDYAAFNTVYAELLGAHKPARTVLGGYSLRDGALVELVVEAWRQA